MEKIFKKLFELRDEEYGRFMAKLLPTVSRETIIGVRVPKLRRMARDMLRRGDALDFLEALPHRYYEENMLHALIISEMSSGDEALSCIDLFLPYVDSWGVCDSLRPRSLREGDEGLLEKIRVWISSTHVYTKRFAVEMLMLHFLGEGFKTEYLDTVAGICTEEYYLNMMIGWYFATAISKRYSDAIVYVEEKRIGPTPRAMTIRKCIESHRISDEKKKYLRSLAD